MLLRGNFEASDKDLLHASRLLDSNQTTKAIDIYKSLDKNGSIGAAYNLGMIYGFGINGTKINREKAIKYLKKASDNSHPKAQFYLAMLLKTTPNYNKVEITKLIFESALSGFDEAELALGKILLDLNKTKEAKIWINKALNQENKEAKILMDLLQK